MSVRTVARAKPIEELSEKEWQTQLIGSRSNPGLVRKLGWKAYHTLRSRGSKPGYPDWTLVRERVVFLELKTEAGRLSPTQQEWARALLNAGAEIYVVRPRDLQAIAAVIAARGDPWHGRTAAGPASELRAELGREIDR